MGIKGLPKLIKSIAGKYAVKDYDFLRFKGMTVAVDTSIMIHQIVTGMRGTGRDLKNSKGEITSHIMGIFYKTLLFLENEMVPIYVFDGEPPDIKNKTRKIRINKKQKLSEQLEDIETDSENEEYVKLFRQTFQLKDENIKEIQILLDLMGVPYIQAPGEADVICTWLSTHYNSKGKRYAKGVCSDDSDMLALGAPYIFKNMIKNMGTKNKTTVISLNKSLKKMDLSMKQFVGLCVLLGTDYCTNIKGIGPKNAYKLMQKYKSFNKIIKIEKKKNNTPEFLENVECMYNAYSYFNNSVNEIDTMKKFKIVEKNLQLKIFQHDELLDFMCIKHNFDPDRIRRGLHRLQNAQENMNVTSKNTKKVHILSGPIKDNSIFIDIMSPDFNISFSDSDDTSES